MKKTAKTIEWPKGPTSWVEGRTLKISIPFTWNLPEVKARLEFRDLFYDDVIIGGPGAYLIPDYFDDSENVTVSYDHEDVLERINPDATRTTIGCPRRCKFCAVGQKMIEPAFKELDFWEPKPIVMDNNLLAASETHIEKVMVLQAELGAADFNQGIDARLMTPDVAALIKRIKHPIVRLALDHSKHKDPWMVGFENLRSAGVAKSKIRSYCIVGFDDSPEEAWERCYFIEAQGIKPLPMWFHELDALARNEVTEAQEALGWTDYERRRIMQWFYQHKEAVK